MLVSRWVAKDELNVKRQGERSAFLLSITTSVGHVRASDMLGGLLDWTQDM